MLFFAFYISCKLDGQFSGPMAEVVSGVHTFKGRGLSIEVRSSAVRRFRSVKRIFGRVTSQVGCLVARMCRGRLLTAGSRIGCLRSRLGPRFRFGVLTVLDLGTGVSKGRRLCRDLGTFSGLVRNGVFHSGRVGVGIGRRLRVIRFCLFLRGRHCRSGLVCRVGLSSRRVGRGLVPQLLVRPLIRGTISRKLRPRGRDKVVGIDLCRRGASRRSTGRRGVGRARRVGELRVVIRSGKIKVSCRGLGRSRRGRVPRGKGVKRARAKLGGAREVLRVLCNRSCRLSVRDGGKGKAEVRVVLPSREKSVLYKG